MLTNRAGRCQGGTDFRKYPSGDEQQLVPTLPSIHEDN
jgi:hypothetical protein